MIMISSTGSINLPLILQNFLKRMEVCKKQTAESE